MDNSLKALATNQLYQLWSERVKDCRNSGLPVKMWCFNNNVKVSTYYAWQKRLFNAITKPETTEIVVQTKKEFAEIPVERVRTASNQVPVATIVVGGTSVEVYNSIQPELLQTILKGLKSC